MRHVRQNPPCLILLDIMIPELDGMEVCREVRKFSSVPIIMLTARVEEIDRLLGLELGPTTTSANRSAPGRSWRV